MDEAQTFAPSGQTSACTLSTLALASQARNYRSGSRLHHAGTEGTEQPDTG